MPFFSVDPGSVAVNDDDDDVDSQDRIAMETSLLKAEFGYVDITILTHEQCSKEGILLENMMEIQKDMQHRDRVCVYYRDELLVCWISMTC
mmetsp:Transcript_5695/g.9439  ORF Transcript_5695/g.9439 Transcript_5695/m.9439 type:complete len:91 (-) Transcript_5695:1185-1457(-)